LENENKFENVKEAKELEFRSDNMKKYTTIVFKRVDFSLELINLKKSMLSIIFQMIELDIQIIVPDHLKNTYFSDLITSNAPESS